MATQIAQLESQMEKKYGLPEGVLGSIRQQETGGSQAYLDDPTKPHYPTGYTKNGTKSSAFGPYGILESTAKDPGYGTTPLSDKSLEKQVEFAAQYLTGRAKKAGSIEAGLAGYGEGSKYSASVIKRIGGNSSMANNIPAASTDINALAASNIERNNVTADALASFQEQNSALFSQAQEVLESQGRNAQLIKTTEAMATAQAQANSAAAARSLGTDPNGANYILDQVAEQYRTNSERAQKFADKVAFVSDPSNILKDPLSYFGNALLYDVNVAAQASAERAAERSRNQYIGLNNMTQEFAQTQSAIKQSVTTETARAAGEMAKSEMDFNVMKLRLDAIRTNSDSVVKIAQLQNDGMNIALRARDQELQEANLINARRNAELQTESLRLSIEERSDRVAAKKETLEDQERFLQTVNLGRSLNGNLPAFPSYKEMQLQASMNPKVKEAMFMQYQQGLMAGETGQATLANNPYDALKYIRATGANISDGRSGVIKMIGETEAEIRKNPKLDFGKMKEPEYAKLVTDGATTRANNMMSNISTGGNNIYSAPGVGVFTQDPEFAKTYISKNILSKQQELGVEQINFKLIANQLVSDMQKGKIDYKTVDSELGFMATKVMGYNNSTYRYNETAGLPTMKSVNVALDDTGSFTRLVNDTAGQMRTSPTGGVVNWMFGGETETIIDLSNPAKRAEYLNKQMTKLIPPVIREQAVKNGAK